MKKILLPLSLISVFSLAQQNTGINTTHPQATLEVASKTQNTTNEVEGLLIPRVSKQKALLMAQNQEADQPEESTLIYINNLADFVDPADGTETTVAAITENGFYHWNGTEWVKVVGKEGTLWKKESGNVVLDPLLVNNRVEYTKTGGYKILPRTIRERSDYDPSTNSVINVPYVLENNIESNYNHINFNYSDLINTDSTIAEGEMGLIYNNLIVDENESSDMNHFKTIKTNLSTNKNLSKDFGSLYASNSSTEHYGTGKINSIRGSNNYASIYNGSTTNIRAVYNQVTDYGAQDIFRIDGAFNRISLRGGNSISSANASTKYIDLGYRNFSSSNTINELNGSYVEIDVKDNFYGSIKDYASFKSINTLRTGATSNITNMYGLKLDDVNWGSNLNYAIYTGEGNIRFKDLAGTGDRVVVADADGVLKTGDQSLAELSSKWVEETDKVILDPTLVNHNVELLKNGGYRFTPKTLRNISDFNDETGTSSAKPLILDETELTNSYHLSLAYSDMLRDDFQDFTNEPYLSKSLTQNLLIIDGNDNLEIPRIKTSSTGLNVTPEFTGSFSSLFANRNAVSYSGAGRTNYINGNTNNVKVYNGNVDYVEAGFNESDLVRGTAKSIKGVVNKVKTEANSDLDAMTANYNETVPVGSGTLTNVYGTRNILKFQSSDLGNNNNIIKNLIGSTVDLKMSTGFKGNINEFVNFRSLNEIESGSTPNITNMYGLKLDDVNLGSNLNYAIYTGEGAIRFKDLAGTSDRLVVADADGVLKTSDQSLDDISSKWIDTGFTVDGTPFSTVKLPYTRPDGTLRTSLIASFKSTNQLNNSNIEMNGYGVFVNRYSNNLNPTALVLTKYRGSLSAPEALQPNDNIGEVFFRVGDNTKSFTGNRDAAFLKSSVIEYDDLNSFSAELSWGVRTKEDTQPYTAMILSKDGGLGLSGKATNEKLLVVGNSDFENIVNFKATSNNSAFRIDKDAHTHTQKLTLEGTGKLGSSLNIENETKTAEDQVNRWTWYNTYDETPTSTTTGYREGLVLWSYNKSRTSGETTQSRVIVADNGNVGIGNLVYKNKMAVDQKLVVDGNVKANTFIATTGGTETTFPDYVFQNYYNGESNLNADYKFKTLNEVEAYIKENGHLPGYISAKEVEKAGQFDMTATQLTNVEKIEELYLHLLEKEKEVKALKAELKAQNARLEKLEQLLLK